MVRPFWRSHGPHWYLAVFAHPQQRGLSDRLTVHLLFRMSARSQACTPIEHLQTAKKETANARRAAETGNENGGQ
jgi:hypothetical protein